MEGLHSQGGRVQCSKRGELFVFPACRGQHHETWLSAAVVSRLWTCWMRRMPQMRGSSEDASEEAKIAPREARGQRAAALASCNSLPGKASLARERAEPRGVG